MYVCKWTFTPTLALFRIKFKFWKFDWFLGLTGGKKIIVFKMGETHDVNYFENKKEKSSPFVSASLLYHNLF